MGLLVFINTLRYLAETATLKSESRVIGDQYAPVKVIKVIKIPKYKVGTPFFESSQL
jgi:hypothetical protein